MKAKSIIALVVAGLISVTYGEIIVGNWDMNSITTKGTTNLVPESSGGSGLRLAAASPYGVPTLSIDGGGASGLSGDKALVFNDATRDRAMSDARIWNVSYSNVAVNLQLYIDADGLPTLTGHAAYLLQMNGAWDLQILTASGQDVIQFATRVGTVLSVRSQDISSYTDQWIDIAFSFVDGVASITVEGITATATNTSASVTIGGSTAALLYVGERTSGGDTSFSGKMDNLIIKTAIPEAGSVGLLLISTATVFVLRRGRRNVA